MRQLDYIQNEKNPSYQLRGSISYPFEKSACTVCLVLIKLEYPLGTEAVKCAREVDVGKKPCYLFNISNKNDGWG